MPLQIGPVRLRFVEHRYVGHVVDPQQREPLCPSHVERHGDDDAPQPAGEGRGVLDVAEPSEGPKIRLLHGVFRGRRVAKHADGHGIRHRLCCPYQGREGVYLAGLRCEDEAAQRLGRVRISHCLMHVRHTVETNVTTLLPGDPRRVCAYEIRVGYAALTPNLLSGRAGEIAASRAASTVSLPASDEAPAEPERTS